MAFLDETGATILADEVKTYVGNTAVAKEAGKGLSTNDYTTTEKNKLSNLNETVLTKLGESADGNLTFDDKEIGANIMVDKELSDTSTNPLQNKVVKSALDEKLSTSGDSKDVVSSFSSNDSTSETTIWTDVPALNSSEKHSSIFNKISTMFKNIRYLYKMLGTADISTLGEGANIGTVTGALSKLNSDLKVSNGEWQPVLLSGGDSISISHAFWYKMGSLVQINLLAWGSKIINPNDYDVLISLPFRTISSRNYGQTGFNASGIEFHPAITVENNAIHFLKRVQGEEVVLNGKNFPDTTFQCSIQYFTNE